ncbi:response regulator [Sphingomonas morindae]|uniref:histidine kinase n=1 Tax=Sphingomonas morindae TaxID=1541170 RepID=A0ABY4X495_9SPHN|nr:response regulator [Sphingomonas morindae]USI71696.1 response regulator [Sphingomonas morindae]
MPLGFQSGQALELPQRPSRSVFLLVGLLSIVALSILAVRIQVERHAALAARGEVIRSFARRVAVNDVLTGLVEAESAQRGFILTGAPAFLTPYAPARRSIAEALDRLGADYRTMPAQQAHLVELRYVVGAKLTEMDDVLARYRQGGLARARTRVEDQQGRTLMERARTLVAAIVADEGATLAAGVDRAGATRRHIDIILGVVLLLLILLVAAALLVGWRVGVERHKTEQQAWESLTRLRTIFASTTDALIILDSTGLIESVNAATDRLFGYARDELIGRDIGMLLDAAPGDAPLARRLGLSTEGTPARGQGVDRSARHKRGHIVPVDVSLARLPLAEGFHLIATLRDISERKAAERLKDEFISTVSHELRTPLTSVIGALGLLSGGAAGPLPEPALRLLTIAENNAQRLIRLINDILDIDRIGSGRIQLRSEPIDLPALARRAVDDAAGLAAPRGVGLRLDAHPVSRPALGDGDRLLQVLGNLLSNAIRFSPEGETVTLALREDGDRAVLEVADHGPGVPDAFRDRIFGRFAQSEAGAAIPGGTGLGLAISREIVHALGGEIEIDKDRARGACFRIALPLHARPIDADTARPRMLICEDDPDMATIIGDIIAGEGYEVEQCGSAREAQALARSGRFDGLVLDLRLPDANGLAAVRALRAEPTTRDLPIIVVSAFANSEGGTPVARALDVVDWLDKPVDRPRLLRALATAMRRAREDRPTLLHVDDDPDMLEVTALGLADRGRMLRATSLAAARALLASRTPDIVILDINLPDGSGLDLLPDLFAADGSPIPTIVYSATDLVPEMNQVFDAVLVKSRRSLTALSETIGAILDRQRARPREEEA